MASNSKSVLLLFSSSEIGGAERSLSRMAFANSNSSLSYQLATFGSAGSWSNWVESKSIECYCFNYKTSLLLKHINLHKPDVIYIDYLNICASFRIRGGINAGSYTIVKAIAEELRGLAVEFNVPIISATQTNRAGFSSSDIGLEDTSESFGLPATADFMLAISQTEELEHLNQYMVKQLKNRYADPSFHRRFVVGVDKSKMRLFDVEQSAQKELVDDTPLFDRTSGSSSKDLKSMFDDFK